LTDGRCPARAANPLAIRYNDNSVLENHHCASLFALLSKAENNVFAPLMSDRRKYKVIRSMVRVLAACKAALTGGRGGAGRRWCP
jgi:hypothetical protein